MEDLKPGIGFYAKVIHNKVDCKANHMLKGFGLTMTQYDVIKYLACCQRRGIPVKQKDLENYFHISNPTVSVMLDRLELKDLIVRTRSEEDKRIRYVVLTEKAEELLKEIAQGIKEAEESMMQGLSESQIEQGMEFLQRIMENLCKMDQDSSKEVTLNDSNACRAN